MLPLVPPLQVGFVPVAVIERAAGSVMTTVRSFVQLLLSVTLTTYEPTFIPVMVFAVILAAPPVGCETMLYTKAGVPPEAMIVAFALVPALQLTFVWLERCNNRRSGSVITKLTV
jgi:hypothetical protein